ncbi:inositol monophosphatase [Candidatus Babeliales bacterium]|nr:inositol monophosphatase [Candidatus Babeliales bacterium]
MKKISRNTILLVSDIVKTAGKLLLDCIDCEHTYTDKEDGSFATEADYKSEKYLKENLSKIVPEASFLAEESGQTGKDSAEYTWVIDPLDGTTNFAHGFPYFAVSVALVYKNEPIIGVIYNPIAEELFWSGKGLGAFLNDKPIKISQEKDLSRALSSIAVPYRKVDCDDFFSLTDTLEHNVYSFRKLGCAALDMAAVASGRLDGAVLKFVSWWDIAAGIVLVREAGGIVSEFDKEAIGSGFSTCLASNGWLHKDFQRLLS